MPPAPPPFLPTSALALELDAYVAVTAAMHAGFADARVSFECTFPHLPSEDQQPDAHDQPAWPGEGNQDDSGHDQRPAAELQVVAARSEIRIGDGVVPAAGDRDQRCHVGERLIEAARGVYRRRRDRRSNGRTAVAARR